MSLICERLVFLSSSIEKLLSSPEIQHLCISRICQTRSYLKCCYISLQNFLIEILEVTDISKTDEFVFCEEIQHLSGTSLVAIGLRSNNLDLATKTFQDYGIDVLEYHISPSNTYPKGYK